MLTETAENYIKAIFELEESNGHSLVSLGDIAKRVGVTGGTATTMLKRFETEGLLTYEQRKGALLTKTGKKCAQTLVMKHRLIECFLVDHLGMDWSVVHDEAERLEHAMSDLLLEKLDAFLGHPDHDPHGHKIPRQGPDNVDDFGTQLWHIEIGSECIIHRVEEEKSFLQFLNSIGLRLGLKIIIKSRNEVGQIMTILTKAGEVQVSMHVATRIHAI